MSPADDILVSEAGFFYRRIVSAVSTVVSKTTSVSSNLTAPAYLRSIMEECNGLLIRFSGFLRNPYRTRFAGLEDCRFESCRRYDTVPNRIFFGRFGAVIWQRGRVGRLRLPAKELDGKPFRWFESTRCRMAG